MRPDDLKNCGWCHFAGCTLISGDDEGFIALTSTLTGMTTRLINDHKGAPIHCFDVAPVSVFGVTSTAKSVTETDIELILQSAFSFHMSLHVHRNQRSFFSNFILSIFYFYKYFLV